MPTPVRCTSARPISPSGSGRHHRPRATCGSTWSSRRPLRPVPTPSIPAMASCPSERPSPGRSRTPGSSSSGRRRPSSRRSGTRSGPAGSRDRSGSRACPGPSIRWRSTAPTRWTRSSPRPTGSAIRCWSRRRPAAGDGGCAGLLAPPTCRPRWPPDRPRPRRRSATGPSSWSARSGRRGTSRSSCWAMRPGRSSPSANATAHPSDATRSSSRRRRHRACRRPSGATSTTSPSGWRQPAGSRTRRRPSSSGTTRAPSTSSRSTPGSRWSMA